MRTFTRMPPFAGADDPERQQPRGTLGLGETVQIETVGGHDQDYEAIGKCLAGDIMEVHPPRRSRPAGPFVIEGIRAGEWIAVEILAIEVGPYGFYRNGGPHWASMRLVAPVRDGLIHFPPDFVVPVRPMIGVIMVESVASHEIDHGGNMDFNSVQPGSVVHLRTQKDGALLSLGDAHARMGDGEMTGTGVEIDATVTLRVNRSPGFPCGSPVVEKSRIVESAEEYLTSGQGATWEEAVKVAWFDMVGLIADRYQTTTEYANLIVGTIADVRPGYAAGMLNQRGRPSAGAYVTCQMAVTKELRRTGVPYQP